MIKNIPNLLSSLRAVISFALLFNFAPAVLGILFLLGAVSDVLDGLFAKVFGCASRLGKFLDPLADKIFIYPYLSLVWKHIEFIPEKFYVFGLLFLDTASTSLYFIRFKRSIGANSFGRAKTAFLFSAVFCLFFSEELERLIYSLFTLHIGVIEIGNMLVQISFWCALISVSLKLDLFRLFRVDENNEVK